MKTPFTNFRLTIALIAMFSLLQVSFTKAANTITTGAISGSSFCPGAAVSVPFTKAGTYNSANTFRAELSDSLGSFTTPVVIGTKKTSPISAIIPATASAGTLYRIRVVSTSPVVTGTDNGSNLTILSSAACVEYWSTTGNSDISASNFIGTIDNSGLRIRTNNVQQAIIDSLGNLGVGLNNPGSPGTGARSIELSATQFPQYILQASSATLNNKTWRMIARNSNVFQIQTLDDTYGTEKTALEIDRSTDTITKVLFPNGNVGIGTTTPAYPLDITGNANINGNAYVHDLLGIGTTGPLYPLDVVSPSFNIAEFKTTGTSDARIVFTNPSSTFGGVGYSQFINAMALYTFGANDIVLGTSNLDQQIMRLQASTGFVGIGTTAPQQNLSVNAAINVDQANLNDGVINPGGTATTGAGITFGSTSGEGIASKRTSGGNQHGLDFYTSFANRMSLTNGGRLGIGTTNPAAQLHVAVSSGETFPQVLLYENTTGYSRLNFQNASGSSYWAIAGLNSATNADELLNFFNSTTGNIMSITGNGNVGIGTTSPAYRLDVCGTIRAKEALIETGWCDYVFDKNYKLKSIEELEQYINANNHLPGVAPASEVEKDGLKIGEMNKAMMEKIEELSLYIIQLQKEIDALKK